MDIGKPGGAEILLRLVRLQLRGDVALVEKHQDGALGELQPLHDLPVPLPHPLAGVHQEEDGLHVTKGVSGGLLHVLPQLVLGGSHAGGVQEDHLILVPGEDAGDSVPGGLGPVRYDGDLLAHQGVDEGGFAYVGAADQAEKTALVRHITRPGPWGRRNEARGSRRGIRPPWTYLY